ncbi:hypothetical protein ABS315_11245 [Peribacillus frigoritolerans]|uniref:hypothetical protein n=1 Tax=Peribacillus frigoritolerans TaxID=450367 RepID=UPI0034E0DA1B
MFYLFMILFGLIVFGFILKIRDISRFNNELEFLIEYNESYVLYLDKFLNSGTQSEEESQLYTYLIKKSRKAQELLGSSGLIDYRPAFANYMVSNYPLVANIVQSLRNPAILSDELQWVNNFLLIRISKYEETIARIKREMKNPIQLLQEGVQFFVTFPITLLYWSGIIKYGTFMKISDNIIVKFINFIIIIVGLMSSLVTIVAGWDSVKEIYKVVFNF